MTEMIELLLPLYSISNFFFLYYLKDEINFIALLTFIIGVLHAILPMQKFNEIAFKLQEPEPNQQKYGDVVTEFETDYARCNPATMQRATKEYLEREKQNNFLNEQEGEDKSNGSASDEDDQPDEEGDSDQSPPELDGNLETKAKVNKKSKESSQNSEHKNSDQKSEKQHNSSSSNNKKKLHFKELIDMQKDLI